MRIFALDASALLVELLKVSSDLLARAMLCFYAAKLDSLDIMDIYVYEEEIFDHSIVTICITVYTPNKATVSFL